MKFGEFMAGLRRGLKHVYLLAGAERYYIERAQTAILARLFPAGVQPDDVQRVGAAAGAQQLAELIETVPFLTDKNMLLVEDSPLFRTAAKGEEEEKPKGHGRKKAAKDAPMERLTRLLLAMPEDSYVIFVLHDKPDKRKKLVKTIEKAGAVLEAEPLRPWQVGDWLRDKLDSLGRDMDRDAYEYFMGAISMMQQVSLSYLDREFDKLALFSREKRITKRELLAVFSGLPEVSVFALADAVSAKDVRKALALLTRELADGTYFTVLIALLARHVRQLMEARILLGEGLRGRQLAKPLALNPFIAEKLARAAQGFSDEQLTRALLELADADYLMKTGKGGSELLEHIIIGLCATPARGQRRR